MSFDNHANLARSTVATAPFPASSGTSLIILDATNWPSAPFNCTVWAADADWTLGSAEIIRVTARSGTTLTIARAQEGSTARAIIAGDRIAVTVTAKDITDIEALVGNLTGDVTTAALVATIVNNAVSYAKMQDIGAASKLLGRGDSGSGDPQEITLGTGLSMSGTTLSASAGGAGTIIGFTYYTNGGTIHTTASTSMTDADAINAKVTFTAPASGNVLVVVNAPCSPPDKNVSDTLTNWGLREGSSTIAAVIAFNATPSQRPVLPLTAMFYVTGVSGGSHTYKLAHDIGSTATSSTIFSPLIMVVIQLA